MANRSGNVCSSVLQHRRTDARKAPSGARRKKHDATPKIVLLTAHRRSRPPKHKRSVSPISAVLVGQERHRTWQHIDLLRQGELCKLSSVGPKNEVHDRQTSLHLSHQIENGSCSTDSLSARVRLPACLGEWDLHLSSECASPHTLRLNEQGKAKHYKTIQDKTRAARRGI